MDTKWPGRTRLTLFVSVLAACVLSPQLRAMQDVSGTAAGEPPTEALSVDFQRAPFGLARGQTARFTVFNPVDTMDQPRCGEAGTLCADLDILDIHMLDQHGSLIGRSATIEIPPGEFRSVEFNRDAFLLPGEPGTGRLQIRPVLRITFAKTALGGSAIARVIGSIELVDDLTGRTTVLIPATLLPAIQKVPAGK